MHLATEQVIKSSNLYVSSTIRLHPVWPILSIALHLRNLIQKSDCSSKGAAEACKGISNNNGGPGALNVPYIYVH